MPSIRQNPETLPLPDFRNFGVALRVLLGVNLMALAAALVRAPDVGAWSGQFVAIAAWVEPLLLIDLALLALAARLLRRLPLPAGQALVVGLVFVSALLLADFWRFMGFYPEGWAALLRVGLLAATAAGAMLAYFALRARAFSPALAEARLQALTARIRPHFLFNSLNAVISLIRTEPRRAETALEELAELFRALMRDHRELVPLSEEIALGRQYLDLEKLRLGERLGVAWRIDDVPDDARVPPLMLQPLLENAVYHGIEPGAEPGVVDIAFTRADGILRIEITNPCPAGGAHHAGNHMALANIRERLALHYDLEARLETFEADGRYRVRIDLPCRK